MQSVYMYIYTERKTLSIHKMASNNSGKLCFLLCKHINYAISDYNLLSYVYVYLYVNSK